MTKFSADKIEFHPTSFCDGNGRVFWSGGELYRGIPPKCADFTRRIFAEGIVDELVAKKLIPRTTLTDAALPDYPIVLHHERVPFVSYAYEWSPSMLRDAGLFAIRLLRELVGHGLTLTDVAPWNILFAGGEPVFVDFSSIVDGREGSGRIEHDLRSYYFRSLELCARGHGALARLLLTDYEHGPISDSFDAAAGFGNGVTPVGVVGKIWQRGMQMMSPDNLTKMESRIAHFRFPGKESPDSFSPPLERLLTEKHPSSVLVVGSSAIAFAAARVGAHVVAIDRDEARVDALYEKSRAERVAILPLVVDLRYPVAGHGAENNVLAPALDRLRCGMVIAMGLIPSLVFEQRLRFEQIAGTFARLAQQTLLMEFPSPEIAAPNLRDPYFGWFKLETLVGALRRHFQSVQALPDATGATLLICENASR